MNIEKEIALQLNISQGQVEKVLSLFEEGATIPFIARYRKEQTGSLDEDQLRVIESSWKSLNALQDRKESILNILQEKGLLKDSVKEAIENASTLSAVEEIYRPFKEKRKTKATDAIDAGFGPLAEKILEQKQDPASLADEPGLEQAGYIIAQQIGDDPQYRALVKKELMKWESISSSKKKDAVDENGIYEMYFDFSEPLRSIAHHRYLAMERGEKEKILTVSISSDNEDLSARILRKVVKNPVCRPYFTKVVKDALTRLILPSVKREIRSDLRTAAYEKAIAGFGSNLEHLLMSRPVKGSRILAWDPGYGHGCKLAVLDENGRLLDTVVVKPFLTEKIKPESKEYINAKAITAKLIDTWHCTLVVIGNGTASRESVDFIASLLETRPDVSYVIGSESGASVYSASELAKEEFPDLPVEKRSAVSIGRRVQDPLSELVKIDPKALGVGEYQHDLPQKQLSEMLDFVTDKAVNRVGVNINTASPSLLKHVSGLTKPAITKICKARDKSAFTSRSELQSLLSDKIYEQSIGFIRVPSSKNPYDNTGIHPESYALTDRILQECSLSLSDLRTDAFKKALSKADAKKLAQKLDSDPYTVADILKELANPGLDPRDSLDGPVLKKGVLKIEDLKPGMELQGTVRNVASFGAFVDIGLHENGLVHISRMSKRFIKDPSEIVHAGQIVTVYVVETDLRRKRIALSLLPVKS